MKIEIGKYYLSTVVGAFVFKAVNPVYEIGNHCEYAYHVVMIIKPDGHKVGDTINFTKNSLRERNAVLIGSDLKNLEKIVKLYA